MTLRMSWNCFKGIVYREYLRFVQQKSRFFSSLVRPLLWLIVFAAGFRTAIQIPDMAPYAGSISYEDYISPGLCCMILLFNGMQSSLSMVYDREMGSMRVLLMSPLARHWLLLFKMTATTLISLAQVYTLLLIALLIDVEPPGHGYFSVFPALVLVGLLLSSLGLLLATKITQLENFAGVMNFVIFPMFFLSSALYPLSKMQQANEWLYWICLINPFTHAVELVRHALYAELNVQALSITVFFLILFTLSAIKGFRPQRNAN